MTVQENRTGPLKTDDDFLKALRGLVQDFNSLVKQYNKYVATPMTFAKIVAKPTTLSGYGIVDAAPLKHTHVSADIIDLAPGFSGIVAWSAITGKPYTVDGFGIIDASKVGHKHHWSDILDPPAIMGPPGPAGATGATGATGGTGPIGRGVAGLDGRDGSDSFIPGPRGKDGKDGRQGLGLPGMDGVPGPEPMMVPGSRGPAGTVGPMGPRGLTIPPQEPLPAVEPTIVPGPRGPTGTTGATGKAGLTIPGLDGLSAPEIHIPGPRGTAGTAGSAGKAGAVGMPGLDAPTPQEPLIIRGPAGVAAAASDPTQQSYAPGSYAVPTGKYTQHYRRLTLTGAQRASYVGTAALVIRGISG